MFNKLQFAICFTIIISASVYAQSTKPGFPKILPRDLEVELALSSAPSHLQDEATVYVLGENGYELAIQGSNGWTCFVVRGPGIGPPSWDDMIAGWCYDEEGMKTMGLVTFDRAKYRSQGLSNEEIRNKINEGFATGKYLSPRKPGVIYMLSPVNKVPDHRTGKLFDYVPHVMYYAPNITNEDIGVPKSLHTGDPNYVFSGLPYLPIEGNPHGFMVQALGEKEGRQIVAKYKEMIEKVRKYVDLDIRYE
ncbi:MAG: hypothetical protein PVF17_13670 [Ignavibacteria bacterium]